MSYRRQPNVIISGALGAAAGLALIAGIVAVLALPASAQSAGSATGQFERPYGFEWGQEVQPFDANTRDANGNRVVLDGRIMTGMDQSSLSTSNSGAGAWAQATAGAGYSTQQGQAIGNQVNVITQGSYNTVVVTTTQTNSGTQTVLNGRLNLQ